MRYAANTVAVIVTSTKTTMYTIINNVWYKTNWCVWYIVVRVSLVVAIVFCLFTSFYYIILWSLTFAKIILLFLRSSFIEFHHVVTELLFFLFLSFSCSSVIVRSSSFYRPFASILERTGCWGRGCLRRCGRGWIGRCKLNNLYICHKPDCLCKSKSSLCQHSRDNIRSRVNLAAGNCN